MVSLVPSLDTKHWGIDYCKNSSHLNLHSPSQSPTADMLQAALMVLRNLHGKKVTSLRFDLCVVTFLEEAACQENCPTKLSTVPFHPLHERTTLQKIKKQTEMLYDSLERQLTPWEPWHIKGLPSLLLDFSPWLGTRGVIWAPRSI